MEPREQVLHSSCDTQTEWCRQLGDATRNPPCQEWPHCPSSCAAASNGCGVGCAGLSSPAWLVSSPNCSGHSGARDLILGVRHGVSICGVGSARMLLSCLQPRGRLASKLTRELQRCGNPRADRCLWEGKLFLILILETQDLPSCKKSRYYNHHYMAQEKPFCSSSTQLGTVIGTQIEPIVQSKWNQAGCVSVYIFLFFSFHIFLTHFSIFSAVFSLIFQ